MMGFDQLVAEREERFAEDDNDRFGSVPPLRHGYSLVVAQHAHKHDGVLYHRGQFYLMQDERIAPNVESGLIAVVGEREFDPWGADGRILGVENVRGVEPRAIAPSDGALRILAGVGYDPGSACFRLHTAINETTKHTSTFVRWADTNPHCSLRQLDGEKQAAEVRHAFAHADVLHCHVALLLVNNIGVRPTDKQLLIRHYHGSKRDGSHIQPEFDRARGAKLLGARLSLVEEARSFGLEMDWSPIPVPVMRYRALRDRVRAEAKWRPLDGAATKQRPLVVGHSPTQASIKGTSVLKYVVEALQKKGVPIELSLIHGVDLRTALERKALCDVFFDSFWLGIQGSGLEAGAMEMPVIAGDADVAKLYMQEIGGVPYAAALNAGDLAEMLEHFATSAAARAFAAVKTALYVEQYHDYAAVAARYERSLAKWLGRADVLSETR
jgi:hypothetical protein